MSMPETRQTRRAGRNIGRVALLLLASGSVFVSAESCISLKNSKECPAFKSASISTSSDLTGQFSFLKDVSDQKSFDRQLASYIKTTYAQEQYQARFQCQGLDLKDPSDLYARFTTTVLCNAIVQASISDCKLSSADSRPLCAESCAEYAQSEALITSNKDICSDPTQDLAKLIRSDFTTCHLPEGALNTETCIEGIQNEPDNCGFGSSTIGLCSYCASGGRNSTDTCCYNSNAEKVCKGVDLPSLTASMTLTAPTSSSTSTTASGASGDNHGHEKKGGLSGGAIAGIVIGVLAGLALLAAALFFCLKKRGERPGSSKGSIFNQPSPARKGAPPMSQPSQTAPQGYEVLPGGRIARMSALEGHSGDSPSHHRDDSSNGPPSAVGGYLGARRRGIENSSSDEYGETPDSDGRVGVLRPPPNRRNGSLSSGSVLGSSVPQSPTSAGGFASPPGMASQQSEQLPFFKDYYSQDDIHPGDRVAVLWAYQPRANDEFALERGDMLKVVGIWDDGWATGVLVSERAEEWEARRQAQRDSGVSNTSGRQENPPAADGEIKAFPLVCVCLPEHWRKTIEGDGSTDTASNTAR